MTTNVIDLFATGNQELFHSAFIAWLLDEQGSHGLGSRFLGEFTSSLPAQIAGRLTGSLTVRTEYRSGGSRFDILLEPRSPSSSPTPFKGLVLENKIKSFGSAVQLDKYVAQGFDVLVLALLPETLDDAAKLRYPVVTYSRVRDLLQQLPLDPSNHYHFLIREYRAFLAETLSTYELIARYCNGDVSPVLVLENVKGLGSHGEDEGGVQLFGNELRGINRREGTQYNLQVIHLNAADYGVPQIRERVFLLASIDGRTLNVPPPTHGDGDGLEPYRTAWDAIGDLHVERWPPELDAKGRWARLLPSIPERQNYLWHTRSAHQRVGNVGTRLEDSHRGAAAHADVSEFCG